MLSPSLHHQEVQAALRATVAIVLAGGRGTRLMQLTDHEAKPAVPFAGKFRIIDFPLSNCVNSGIRRIGVLTQYKGHTLIQHVQRGWGFLKAELSEFIEVWPAQQQISDDAWYRGTADAVFQNLQLISGHEPDYVLVLAGDHVYRQDYAALMAHHIETGADVTVPCIEVPKEEASAFGIVAADGNDVIESFVEKPADPPTIAGDPTRSYASMGIYLFNRDILVEHLNRDAGETGSSHDFGKDLIPFLVPRAKVVAHSFGRSCINSVENPEPYWRDVGTLDAYWEANIDLTTVTPSLDLYDDTWPIWTYQVQRPPAKFVFDDDERRGTAIDSMVSAGCIVSGGTVRRSLLYNNVRVNSYAVVEDTVVLPDSDIGRRAEVRRAVIGPGCQIPEGMTIGSDPEEDARRFNLSPKGITLVTKDMLDAL